MRAATRRRIAVPAAIVSGVLVSGLLVWHTSYAAFTASSANLGSSFQAGSVAISDNDAGSALFTATAISPGASAQNCITVTYGGTLPGSVRLAAAYTDTVTAGANDLAQYLTFKIEEVGLTGTCDTPSGMTAVEILASATTLATKVSGLAAPGSDINWNSASNGQQRRYRFSYVLQDNNNAQNKTAGVGFTWTASSL
ncbi:hypothetical protein [Kineosporia sp. NBRC 101731]|uniref:hypothetical protein n=1 Tax=Kineosporia sp. NBRC 101731 TaxID=3032199 RepID=UPI002552CA2D|nr:hypothetical protein [Kineosporia sp. NBRC 101731]